MDTEKKVNALIRYLKRNKLEVVDGGGYPMIIDHESNKVALIGKSLPPLTEYIVLTYEGSGKGGWKR